MLILKSFTYIAKALLSKAVQITLQTLRLLISFQSLSRTWQLISDRFRMLFQESNKDGKIGVNVRNGDVKCAELLS